MRKLPLKYLEAADVKMLVDEIVERLDFSHIVSQSVYCYRSKGSKSKRIIARIHGFGKIWQKALGIPPAYVIEVLSERYDKLCQEDKEDPAFEGFQPVFGFEILQSNPRSLAAFSPRIISLSRSLIGNWSITARSYL